MISILQIFEHLIGKPHSMIIIQGENKNPIRILGFNPQSGDRARGKRVDEKEHDELNDKKK